MIRAPLIVSLCLGLCLGAPAATAHHSMAATYENDQTSTVEGTVTEFRFRNPHVLLYIDVTEETGETVNWMGEGPSATGMTRLGWDKDVLKPGDRVSISGDATKDGSPMVWTSQIEYLDAETGNVLAVLTPQTDPKAAFAENGDSDAPIGDPKTVTIAAQQLFGIPNFSGMTSADAPETQAGPFFIGDPALAYNSGAGATANAAYDLSNDPQIFCEPPGLVRQAGYTPYGWKIIQLPDRILIEYEEYGGAREIPISDELPAPGPKSHLGDSVAHYEGDTLVIETVNLLSNPSGHRGGPLSDEISVVERFTREEVAGIGTVLTNTTTVTDPAYLTEPWTISRSTTYAVNYEYLENECVPPLRDRSD